MLKREFHTAQQVPVHPVQFLSVAELESLPELLMTQAEDGTYYCDGESTQYTQEQGKNLFNQYEDTQIFGAYRGIDISDLVSKGCICSVSLKENGTFQEGFYFGYVFKMNGNPGRSTNFFQKDTDTGFVRTSSTFYSDTCENFIGVNPNTEENWQRVIDNYNIQIELGSKATDYEPFTPAMPSPDYPSPILNTYPAGTYKAICGDKIYKVVLDDDLRSVPGVADRVRIDAGRGVCWVERNVGFAKNVRFVLHPKYFLDDSELFRSSLTFEGLKKSYMYGECMSNTLPNKACQDRNISSFYTLNGYIFARIVGITDVVEFNEKMNGSYFMYPKSTPTTHQSIPPILTTISSGRSVTIHNTVNDAVDMLAIKGDSWQLVQEQGKNLFNIDGNINDVFSNLTSMDPSKPNVNNGDGSITVGSNSSVKAGAGYRIKNVSGKTYMFSCDVLDNGTGEGVMLSVCIPSKINYVLASASAGRKLSCKVTFDSDIQEAIFSFVTINGKNAIIGSIQIEEGDTATDYEPFQSAMPSPEYPSEIVSVEGEMESCGWNIADITAFSADTGNANYLRNSYGTEISTTEPTRKLIVTQTPNNGYVPSSYHNGFFIAKLKNKMIEGRKYIISFDIDITANPFNVDIIGVMPNGTSYQNIKLQENGKCHGIVTWSEYFNRNFLEIRCYGMSFTISNIQITEASQDRPYDRHRGNSITLPVLRSLPDGTADVLYVDRRNKRAWVERYVGELRARSTDSRLIGLIFTAGYYDTGNSTNVAFALTDMNKKYSGGGFGFCNELSFYKSVWSIYGATGYCFNSNQIHMRFPNTVLGVSDDATSDEKKQAWIDYVNGRYNAGNPIIVLYPLAEPVIEDLTYSDYLLQTAQYETNLHIDCNEHLEPEIEVECKVLGR